MVIPHNDPTNDDKPLHALYVQKDNTDAKAMNLADFGLTNGEVLTIKNALITTKQGFIYQLSNDRILTLSGIENAFIENNRDWSIAFATHIKQLQGSTRKKETIQIALHLSISGLLQGDENQSIPLLAWYAKDSQHFVICKTDLGQNLTICGISDGLKGAWMLNNKGVKNKEIGYVPVMNASLLPSLFTGSVLQNEDSVPAANVLTLDNMLGDGFISARVNRKGTVIEGDIQGVTSKGILLNISMTHDNEFKITLIAVTDIFTDEYRGDHLKTALHSLCQNYSYNEMVIVALPDNKKGYYQPKKNILFILANEKYNYFGFDSKKIEAYFSRCDEQYLIRINSQGQDKLIDNQQHCYQREGGGYYPRYGFYRNTVS
ncbi:hypothetical protein [Candidatus Fukatsuia symbiotica]|uniref:hypothetical protein n=1 Tax=Candidatus Fukatsuia symbiotica TaxID=1878942 RepID=UPI0013C321BF|nr:hypothetical protein [Candidatus Fukatsuia symbiotica]